MKGPRQSAEMQPWLAMSPSQTIGLWLELSRAQAGRRRPKDLRLQYEDDPFVALSPLDLRTVHLLDGLALEATRQYEALLLSPVAPLGSCSVVAPTSQDRTLSAARGLEVVSDPTNVLALECARRLRLDPEAVVRLCTVHQVLRAQAVPPRSGFTQHFRLLTWAEAGKGRAEDGFEVDGIARGFAAWSRLFDGAEEVGFELPNRRATVYMAPEARALGRRVLDRLKKQFQAVDFAEEDFDAAYYDGIRVLFGADSTTGQHIPIADIGRFDWVSRYTANRRHRFLAGGLGLQLIPLLFARK